MTQHALLAPSAAHIWSRCFGAPYLWTQLPELPRTDEQEDGDAAHFAAAEMLRGGPMPESAPNGVIVDDEMKDAVLAYVGAVCAKLPSRFVARDCTEVTLPAGSIHLNNWGTPDFCAWIGPRTLFIADLKYGHRRVDAFENWQLINYALLALDAAGIESDWDVEIILMIVQPRNFQGGPIREWKTRATYLRAHRNILTGAAELAHQPQAPLTPGDYCVDCPSRVVCPALESTGYMLADFSKTAYVSTTDVQSKGRELRMLKAALAMLGARESGLEEEIEAALRKGVRVPHWAIEQSSGREFWKMTTEQVIATGKLFKVDLSKEVVALTPRQARAAGMPKEVVDGLTSRPKSQKLTFVPESDARKFFP